MRRKTSRKRIVETTYCIEILKFEPSYMFSLATNPDVDPGPYWEHAEIEIEGVISHPEHLKGRQLRGDSSVKMTCDVYYHYLPDPEKQSYSNTMPAIGSYQLNNAIAFRK